MHVMCSDPPSTLVILHFVYSMLFPSLFVPLATFRSLFYTFDIYNRTVSMYSKINATQSYYL